MLIGAFCVGLLELNPRLGGVTPTTRVAYVKFMQKTLTKREEQDNKNITESNGEVTEGGAVTPDVKVYYLI